VALIWCVICFREGILFALGNPLLDISAEVTEAFLKRWLLQGLCRSFNIMQYRGEWL